MVLNLWLKPGFAHYNEVAMANVPIREEWVGRVIKEQYHLLQWLGGWEGCGVFLAEREDHPGELFAMKLIPAAVAAAEDRAAGWEAALHLDAPEILEVFGHGSCEIDGAEFAYVATEYAPEVLAEVLPGRALNAEETRAVLEPLMDALECLHREGLVHGHVKPSNILADGDQLKLTVDHVLPVGETHEGFAPGAYDAPELGRGVVTPAADVWSLGVTLVEMLTQKRPEVSAEERPVVPEGLPEPFGWIARACLEVDPAQRCGLKEIRAWLRPEAEQETAGGAGAIAEAVPARAIPERVAGQGEPEKRAGMGSRMKVLIAAVAVVVVLIGFRMWTTQQGPQAPERPVPSAQPAPSKSVAAKPAPPPVTPPVTVKGAIVERVPPEVLQSALATIEGTLVVEVRVTVGPNGRVADAKFTYHGPSRYFANASMKAARQWRFRPATVNRRPVNSAWLLRFAYTNAGDEVTAKEVSP